MHFSLKSDIVLTIIIYPYNKETNQTVSLTN